MAATKPTLASGGITHCRLRWGLRTFFLESFRSCCRWPSRRCSIRRPSPRAGAGSNGQIPREPASRSERSISPPSRHRKSERFHRQLRTARARGERERLRIVCRGEHGPKFPLLNFSRRGLRHLLGEQNAFWAFEGAQRVSQLGEQLL